MVRVRALTGSALGPLSGRGPFLGSGLGTFSLHHVVKGPSGLSKIFVRVGPNHKGVNNLDPQKALGSGSRPFKARLG